MRLPEEVEARAAERAKVERHAKEQEADHNQCAGSLPPRPRFPGWARFPVLAANLDTSAYPNAEQLRAAVPPYAIKIVGGVRFGIVGVTTFSMIYASYLSPVKITEPVAALQPIVNALRPQVDVLLLTSHNDFTENQELARQLHGVDAVISGHTHLKTPQASLIKGPDGRKIPVVETGCWARFLGDLKLSYYPGSKRVEFKSFNLHPVEPTLQEDPDVVALVDEQDRRLGAKFHLDPQETIADSEIDLLQSDVRETPLGNLMVQAYRHSTHADLSLEETSFGGVSVAAGPITWTDVHDVIPHIYDPILDREWTLHLWQARGKDLLLLFNTFQLLSGLMPGRSPVGWISADNVDVIWNAPETHGDSPGIPLVSALRIGGQPLIGDATYSVVLTDGLLRGIEIINSLFHLGIDLTHLVDTGEEAWRSVANYTRSLGKLTLKDLRIGRQSFATGADLAVHYYNLKLVPGAIAVQVENHGLVASAKAKLECFQGLRDDVLRFETDEQKWSSLGRAKLPPIAARGSATGTVAWGWDRGLAPGRYPVRCRVDADGETYGDNNQADKVFAITQNPYP